MTIRTRVTLVTAGVLLVALGLVLYFKKEFWVSALAIGHGIWSLFIGVTGD
jgi:hypothetical protein